MRCRPCRPPADARPGAAPTPACAARPATRGCAPACRRCSKLERRRDAARRLDTPRRTSSARAVGQRSSEATSAPRRLVAQLDRASADAGELLVGLDDHRAEPRDQHALGRGRTGRRSRPASRPTRRASARLVGRAVRRLLQQRVALLQRRDRARAASRRTSPPAPRATSSRNRRRSPGPSLTSARSSGENTVTRITPSSSRAARSRCRLTSTRLRPLRLISASTRTSRPSSWTHRRPARPPRRHRRGSAHRSGRRGSCRAWRGRPAPRRGSSCPGRCARRPPWCPRSNSNVGVAVVAEVDELQPPRRSRRQSIYGTRTGISRYRYSSAADAADHRRLQARRASPA